jgi:hypothetical protein
VDPPPLPAPADRRQHGLRLTAELEAADTTVRRRRHERATPVDTVEGAVEGLYLSFDSFPGLSLALEELDPRQGGRHPELMSVHTVELGAEQPPIERATVFVPEGTLGYFLTRMNDYVTTADMAAPRRRDLVERIATVHAASIEALWTDPADQFPPSGRLVWWEVWLRRRDGRELSRLRAFAAATGVRVGPHSLGFGDRTVVLMQATAEQLADAVDVLDDLAELRRPFEQCGGGTEVDLALYY